jgi:glycosyltransferase involved in cell wall biosynthesis
MARVTPPVQLSVALVTRNRPASLERALASWRRQDPQPFEIVISDDSEGEAASETARLAARHACRYVAGPRRGLYANRNHAAASCHGSHILSADDDHEHPQGLVARIVAAAGAESQTVWCIGEFATWRDHDMQVRFSPPGQLTPHGSLTPIPSEEAARSWAIADGATVYPRAIFDGGLRMYEGIRFGASYCEFGCLLHRLGWRIRPLTGAAIIHHAAGAPRSFSDAAEHAASELFAALMYSFHYQPSAGHMLTTLSKLPIQLWRQRPHGARVIAEALAHFRARLPYAKSAAQGRPEAQAAE